MLGVARLIHQPRNVLQGVGRADVLVPGQRADFLQRLYGPPELVGGHKTRLHQRLVLRGQRVVAGDDLSLSNRGGLADTQMLDRTHRATAPRAWGACQSRPAAAPSPPSRRTRPRSAP